MSMSGPRLLPNYDDALARVLSLVPALGAERVALTAALGRVLRQDVRADRDQPPFNRSAVDGFAVRSAEVATALGNSTSAGAARRFAVTATIPAGARPPASIAAIGVVRVATGAAVPTEFDAVIPIEQAKAQKTGDGEAVTFLIDRVKPGQNLHRRAVDAGAGAVVLRAGTTLGPQHLGIAATVGAVDLLVSQRPRITVLTTGDEVRPPATPTDELQPQQIRNSNGPMLASFFTALGTPILEHVHVPDDAERTLTAAREALSHSHLVITAGGVSVGERDLLPWAWKRLGLGTVLHGVAIQPGKPVLVCSDAAGEEAGDRGQETGDRRQEAGDGRQGTGRTGHSEPEISNPKSEIPNPKSEIAPSKLVLGLPGNPVSVLATAHLFAWPVLRLMLAGGAQDSSALPWRLVAMKESAQPTSKRQVFRAARLNADGSASLIHWHGSGDLMHTAEADGFVRLPLTDEDVKAGTMVPFLAMVR